MRWTARVAVPLTALLALASAGALVAAAASNRQASGALEGALRVRAARLAVVEAQGRLQGTDVEEVLGSIQESNAAAERVGDLTRRLLTSLQPTAADVEETVASARDGASEAAVAREQTRLAAELLAVIAGYQAAASDSAASTNRALRHVLAELRRTNREFPFGGDG